GGRPSHGPTDHRRRSPRGTLSHHAFQPRLQGGRGGRLPRPRHLRPGRTWARPCRAHSSFTDIFATSSAPAGTSGSARASLPLAVAALGGFVAPRAPRGGLGRTGAILGAHRQGRA